MSYLLLVPQEKKKRNSQIPYGTMKPKSKTLLPPGVFLSSPLYLTSWRSKSSQKEKFQVLSRSLSLKLKNSWLTSLKLNLKRERRRVLTKEPLLQSPITSVTREDVPIQVSLTVPLGPPMASLQLSWLKTTSLVCAWQLRMLLIPQKSGELEEFRS